MRILLVGNPTAQSGFNAARIERARAEIEREGARCEVFATLPEGATVGTSSLRHVFSRTSRQCASRVAAVWLDRYISVVHTSLLGC